MKAFIVVFAVLAGVCATFQTDQNVQGRFLVTPRIREAIYGLSESIKEAGLDPLNIEKENFSYRLPVTDLLTAQAAVEDILVQGLSNIAIHELDFSAFFGRLRFDLSLPLISANIGSANGGVNFANRRATAEVSGSLNVVAPRLSGEIIFHRLQLLARQLQVVRMAVNFRIAEIRSNFSVEILEEDHSAFVNNIFGVVIPTFFTTFRTDINRLLVHYMTNFINEMEI